LRNSQMTRQRRAVANNFHPLNRQTYLAAVDEGPQGFEASVHKIKEQVLPRLLERMNPEAAASLNKEELPKNSVRSFLKCWPNSS
jgi:hypothetical protein